jgi:hypothetical protein
MVDEMLGLNNKQQAERIADHYSAISNHYEQIKSEDFLSFKDTSSLPLIEPLKVHKVVGTMNNKSATIPGDLPMRLISELSVELASPLAHLVTSCMKWGVYPNIYKVENVTPVPKTFPPEKLKS